MKIWTLIVILLLTATLTGSIALAGTVHPALEEQLQQKASHETIKALVTLQDRVNIKALDQELHAAKAPMSERRKIVLSALHEKADATQKDLLTTLEAMKRSGEVVGYTPHWLVNGVVVLATPDALRALAARGDVDLVEPDLEVELIEPASPPVLSRGTPDKAGKGYVGTSPGLRAMGIERVWNELGLDGTGVIVGVMDTGVDGIHPNLAANWHGNFVPADQAWLDVSNTGHPDFPEENQYHGTHVTSLICGQPAYGDTIGVAPGAHWIATNMLWSYAGDALDNAVLASLEFMADPDGDPATTDDMPAVVNNSWGVNETYQDYNDCDSNWWDAMDAVEAAGIVLLWAAGNEGEEGPQSLRSPADRASSPFNSFAVGSTAQAGPYLVSDFSSRGPSGCGGPFAIKPELTAIGEDVFGAYPDSNWAWISGTSQATPQVAGVVALMRQANPDLDVITIKNILMETAVDLGAPGEENDYGHGILDAFAAVTAALGPYGVVEGTVTDAATGLPLQNALVGTAGLPQEDLTDAAGYFRISLPEGSHTLEFEAYGYVFDSLGVTVIDDAVTDGSHALNLSPHSTVSGHVYDPESLAVAGAVILALGVPIDPVMTDASGYYELLVPTGFTYTLNAMAVNLANDQHVVTVSGDMSQDFHMPALEIEDFELGHFVSYDWYMPVAIPWEISDTEAHTGSFCATAGEIPQSSNAVMAVTMDVLADSELRFHLKVSSEEGGDHLWLFMDGDAIERWSGEIDWTEYVFPIPAGTHEIGWVYLNVSYSAEGADRVWVDNIVWPTIAAPVYPVATALPAAVNAGVLQNETVSRLVTVENTGPADLNYRAEVTLHDIIAPVGGDMQGVGGPDAFGHYWFDSTNPAGPVFDWVDISEIGQDTGHMWTATLGPFDLGFTFNYYGRDFTDVFICSNGWLTPGYTTNNYGHGSPLPDPSNPNDMVAAFWDVLYPRAELGSQILYHTDTLNQRFIAQWDSVYHSPTYGVYEDPEVFQIILDADGSILFQYKEVRDALDCTIGMENGDGTDGLTVAHNEPYLVDGHAVKFMKIDPWLSSSPDSNMVPTGGSETVQIDFTPGNLPMGLYAATLTIVTNDPLNHRIEIPVTMDLTDPQSAVDDILPRAFGLGAAHPNPFNPLTQISYDVPNDRGMVNLKIYNLAGREVRTLVSGQVPAGHHTTQWNGKDNSGQRVASGVYFYRLTAPGYDRTRKMTLIK